MFRFLFALAVAFALAGAVHSSQLPMNPGDTVHTTESWEWMDCGNPSDPVQIRNITVFPDPPKPGQDLTVTVSGTVKKQIEEGAFADVVVKIGVIVLLKKEFDVCDEARNANASVQCPVAPNDYTFSHTVALPKEVPRAKFTIAVRGYTVDVEDMLCLNLKVDFMKHFPGLQWLTT